MRVCADAVIGGRSSAGEIGERNGSAGAYDTFSVDEP